MPSRSKRHEPQMLRVFSDFDNTIVHRNTAALLMRHYLTHDPHHEPFYRRLSRVGLFVSGYLRRRYIGKYYACLRRIPGKERHDVLRGALVHPAWLRAIKQLRLKHKSKRIHVIIITRNCIDVVHDWVMQNRDVFRTHHVEIDGIVANGPLRDHDIRTVRGDLKHFDYVALGQLMEQEKAAFLGRDAIYIGDADDELLRPLVREFIRI